MPLAARVGGPRTIAVLAATLLLATFVAACSDSNSGGDATPDATPASDGPTLGLEAAGYLVYEDETTGIRTVLGTPDLGVGRQRVSFVLSDEQGLIRLPVVTVATYYLAEGSAAEADPAGGTPIESATAQFYEFPLGTRGLYAVELSFDRPGTWAIEAQMPEPGGTTVTTRFDFEVAERPSAPAVGDLAPRSINRTLDDVDSVHDLSTGADPDPELYRLTIAEALDERRPLVVVFASPGFCTNALCGPQAELLSSLRTRHAGDANFIHVDLYENPTELQSDFDRAVRTPLLEEWGLHTDEWTFIVDRDGRIAARFEAFATEQEVEAALLTVLRG